MRRKNFIEISGFFFIAIIITETFIVPLYQVSILASKYHGLDFSIKFSALQLIPNHYKIPAGKDENALNFYS